MPAAPAAPPQAAPPAQAPARSAAPAAPAAPARGAAPAAPAEPADPFLQSFSDMDKFTQKGKDEGLPEQRAPKPPGAKGPQAPPKPKVDPNRPGEQGVEDPTKTELEETPHEPSPEEKAALEKQQQQAAKEKDQEPRVDDKGVRKDPWKLVENYRARYRDAVRELDEVRSKGAPNGEPPAEWKTKYDAIEARNKELENEISFTNYTKSKEFIDQYQAPYLAAWKEAVYALSGLKVRFEKNDPETGETAVTERDMTQDDITILANMKPEDARKEMKARFPEDWAEVKSHVDKVRAISNAQNAHLEERRKSSGEWQKQQTEQHQAAISARVQENRKIWADIIAEDQKKFGFLRPIEGETQRNEWLDKATAFIEDALKSNAMDPRLSPEQRQEVLRKHVAMRNRAIGFSVLNHENKTLKAKVAELEKSLAQYQESEPTAGQGRGREGTAMEVSTLDQAAEGLRKYAR